MAKRLLRVDLPWCPTCDRVGKIPVSEFAGKNYCSGGDRGYHRRTRMEPKLFIEKRSGQ